MPEAGRIGLEGTEVQDDLPVGFRGHRVDRDLEALLGETERLRLGELLDGHVEHELVTCAVDQRVRADLLHGEAVCHDVAPHLPTRAETDLLLGELDPSQDLARVHNHAKQANRNAGPLGLFVELSCEYVASVVQLDPATDGLCDRRPIAELLAELVIKPVGHHSHGLHDVHWDAHSALGDRCWTRNDVKTQPGQQRHRRLVAARS